MIGGKKLRIAQQGNVMFWCPGCNEYHIVKVEGTGRPIWDYNGNPDAPTFGPSILVTSGHYVTGYSDKGLCDKSGGTEPCTSESCFRCHSYVRDGMIQFLSDSTHQYAGQTVPLPDL